MEEHFDKCPHCNTLLVLNERGHLISDNIRYLMFSLDCPKCKFRGSLIKMKADDIIGRNKFDKIKKRIIDIKKLLLDINKIIKEIYKTINKIINKILNWVL